MATQIQAQVNPLRIVVLISSAFLLLLQPIRSLNAQNYSIKQFSKKLEKALNSKNQSNLNKLISEDISPSLNNKYNNFIERFPNAKWEIYLGKGHSNQYNILNTVITSEPSIQSDNYSLNSQQKISLNIINNKITDYKVLSHYSILQNAKDPLSISIAIPDKVLTGSKYDIDLIIDEPLEDSIIAGGLISLQTKEIFSQPMPDIDLLPMGGGGLFKTVQAPLEAGQQNWAAIIAHPKGIISITKIVRIISDKDN